MIFRTKPTTKMIPEDKKETLREIVEEYLVKQGLIPKGMRVNMMLTLVPVEPVVTVVDETVEYDPKVLDLSAIESFSKFCIEKNYDRCREFTSVINTFTNSGSSNIRSVVTRFSDEISLRFVDYQWSRYRGFGKKSLILLGKWLKSLNLHLGMKL